MALMVYATPRRRQSLSMIFVPFVSDSFLDAISATSGSGLQGRLQESVGEHRFGWRPWPPR